MGSFRLKNKTGVISKESKCLNEDIEVLDNTVVPKIDLCLDSTSI